MNKMENGKESVEQLCIKCAREVGVPGIDNLLKQTGMEEDELNHMMEHMNDMFDGMDPEQMNISDLMGMMNGMDDFDGFGIEEDYEEDDLVELMDEEGAEEPNATAEKTEQKKKKKKKRFAGKKHLETYGTNLTDKAKNGDIDAIIGRQREIDRMVQILNRRTKNNPVLIGEQKVWHCVLQNRKSQQNFLVQRSTCWI
jgi:ATP-dependent Clp protease ATP-binding subunit ClpA